MTTFLVVISSIIKFRSSICATIGQRRHLMLRFSKAIIVVPSEGYLGLCWLWYWLRWQFIEVHACLDDIYVFAFTSLTIRTAIYASTCCDIYIYRVYITVTFFIPLSSRLYIVVKFGIIFVQLFPLIVWGYCSPTRERTHLDHRVPSANSPPCPIHSHARRTLVYVG